MQNYYQTPPPPCGAGPAYNLHMSPERCKAILALGFKEKALIAWQLTWARLLPYFGVLFLLIIISAGYNAIIVTLCKISIGFSVLFIPFDIITMLFSFGILATILRYIDGPEPRIRAKTLFEPFTRWLSLLPIAAIYICLTLPDNLRQLGAFEETGYYISMFFTGLSWFFLAYFYFFMADCRTASTRQILQMPFYLLTNQPRIWLQAMLMSILVYGGLFLIGLLMVLIVSFVSPDMDLVACYIHQDFATADLPGALLILLFMVILLLLLPVLSIYTMFLFAIAYRQSIIAYGEHKNQGA